MAKCLNGWGVAQPIGIWHLDSSDRRVETGLLLSENSAQPAYFENNRPRSTLSVSICNTHTASIGSDRRQAVRSSARCGRYPTQRALRGFRKAHRSPSSPLINEAACETRCFAQTCDSQNRLFAGPAATCCRTGRRLLVVISPPCDRRPVFVSLFDRLTASNQNPDSPCSATYTVISRSSVASRLVACHRRITDRPQRDKVVIGSNGSSSATC